MNTHSAIVRASIFGFLSSWTPLAISYDGETHALIASLAFHGSVLNSTGPNSVVTLLGLDRLDVHDPFAPYWPPYAIAGSAYYDNLPQAVPEVPPPTTAVRIPNPYEACLIANIIPSGFIPLDDTMIVPHGAVNNTIENWIIRGDVREDDVLPGDNDPVHCDAIAYDRDPWPSPYPRRVMGHFYDPVNDRMLTPYDVPCVALQGFLLGPCEKSVDWALGVTDSFAVPSVVDTLRLNHFSYVDARENLWLALTEERNKSYYPPPYTSELRSADAVERLYRWATVFRSLGDVIHLLQDGAQPQHVRNDPHSPRGASKEQQAFEHYTNARITHFPDELNAYIQGFYSPTPESSLPPLDLSNPYPVPTFPTPLRFFTTRGALDGPGVLPDSRYGLMDYTNRGFFTGGTLPGYLFNDFLEPPMPVDEAHGYVASLVPCVLSAYLEQRFQAGCTHWTHLVLDSVNPEYIDAIPAPFGSGGLPPLVAEGVLSKVADVFGQPLFPGYALGLGEFQTMANFTIPRAIAYSAGLINYFFRGKLDVSAPDDGVYSIINHGTPHTVDADGIPHPASGGDTNKAFGFETLRVKVKNSTPAIVDSGSHDTVSQTTGGAGAVAVVIARYHRNPCYTPALTGEVGVDYLNNVHLPVIGCTSVRTPVPEISVSAPLPISAGELDGSTAPTLTFDFSNDPIPINATDFFLQVAYRGPLGDEADGIAVGATDVSEPTYIIEYNLTDYYHTSDDTWEPWSPVPPPPSLDVTDLIFCFDNWQVFATGAGQQLPENHLVRLAVISDFNTHYWSGIVSYQGQFAGLTGTWRQPWSGRFRQAADEPGTGYYADPLGFVRGFNAGDVGDGNFNFFGPPLVDGDANVWGQLPDITTPGVGLTSENIGAVTLPGTTACPAWVPTTPEGTGIKSQTSSQQVSVGSF